MPDPFLNTLPLLRALDWGTQLNTRNVSVYFAGLGQTFDGMTSEGFNVYERARFAEAFDLIEAVTNLRFTVTGRAWNADFKLVLDLNEDVGGQAYFNPPEENNAGVGVFDGTQWSRYAGGDLATGGYSFATMTHELLHGLGIAHPHDDGGGSRLMPGVFSNNDLGSYDLNQGIFTTMSYNTGYQADGAYSQGSEDYRHGYEIGPMALDIAVLQQKYGANTTTGTDNNMYVLPGENIAGTGWRAIWDVIGQDTIKAAEFGNAIIDLRAATLRVEDGGGGYISAQDNVAGGFTIAHGVVIENAIGGTGNDRLTGNTANNTLDGGNGNDYLISGGGSDVLIGAGGYDRAIVPFLFSDIVSLSQSDDGGLYLGVQGADDFHTVQLRGVEWLTFADESGKSLSDLLARVPDAGVEQSGAGHVTGTDANDTLNGSAGNDFIDGGSGADVMAGGLGNDFYVVDDPLDRVLGEEAYSAGGGIDTVRAFVDYVQPANIELVRLANIGDNLALDAKGNDAPGTLVGNLGSNNLNGRGGNDQINGNGGDDILTGGIGRDTLVGGSGADQFIYGSISESRAGSAARDVINGFTHGQDRIDLRGIDANTGTFGVDDAFVFVGSRGFSGTAGELRTQSLGGPNAVLIEADINGDSTADFHIFVNLTTYMSGSDFLL